MSHSTDIEQRLRGENPEHCVVTDRLRANIGMPDTFQFNRDDAVELDELVLEAADELARLEADNASLRSRLEEVEGALEEAAGTLEGLSYIHDGNPSDAMADMPAVEYARHMLYEARQLAKAAHSEARSALASIREADHA